MFSFQKLFFVTFTSIAVIFHFFVSATPSVFWLMVRDLMTNCRHLILFLVVQKILASLKLITVFTVTTEGFSQNGSEKKFQPQPDIIIIAHSQNQTSFFFQKELRQFLFI